MKNNRIGIDVGGTNIKIALISNKGEIGHIKLSMNDGPLCGCGDFGCFEAYASGPSI